MMAKNLIAKPLNQNKVVWLYAKTTATFLAECQIAAIILERQRKNNCAMRRIHYSIIWFYDNQG